MSYMTISAATAESVSQTRVSPYDKFKMALKSKEIQRQYPNLLSKFFDFSGGLA